MKLMKLFLFFSYTYSTLIFSQYSPVTMTEWFDLQDYRERNQEVRIIQSQLDELEKNPCIVANDHYNECSKPFVLMQELLEKLYVQYDAIEELKFSIAPYLDENDQILQSIESDLEEQFPLAEYCEVPNLKEINYQLKLKAENLGLYQRSEIIDKLTS